MMQEVRGSNPTFGQLRTGELGQPCRRVTGSNPTFGQLLTGKLSVNPAVNGYHF